MMDAVEVIARDMHNRKPFGITGGYPWDSDQLAETYRDYIRNEARAVIAALERDGFKIERTK